MSSQVIHKFPLLVQAEQTINICTGAWILDFQVQNGVPTIWAMVDPNQTEMVEVEFYIFGIGWPISDDIYNSLRFIGTYMISDGMFVYHVFMKEAVPSHSIIDTPYSPLFACEEKQLEFVFQETFN